MSDVEAALTAMLAMAAAILVVAVSIWTVAAARRYRPPSRHDSDPVLDLTYLERAVKRTEEEGRRNAEAQRRNLGERRSGSDRGRR